jgi:hypothetical protein
VIVPESVPPATCARNGIEISKQSPSTHEKTLVLITFGFIRVHPP